MALNITPTVSVNGLSRKGCYIQLVPYFYTGTTIIPTDRNIWADTEDYDKYPTKGTIQSLDEIPTSFSIDMTTAPKDCDGDTVAIKMLYWVNEQAKAMILKANPTWSDGDIEIVDLPIA